MSETVNQKERIAEYLFYHGISKLNYTKEKAYEILDKSIAPMDCRRVLDGDEEQILTNIQRLHFALILEDLLIGSVEDVKLFFLFLVKSEGLNLDIDLPFEDYYRGMDNDIQTYQQIQATQLNDAMDACFTVCQEKGIDIYELAVEAQTSVLNV